MLVTVLVMVTVVVLLFCERVVRHFYYIIVLSDLGSLPIYCGYNY